MLTHFKDFNFSSLLINLNLLHILFIYSFYCDFLAILDMSCELYEAKLTLAQIVVEGVEGKHIVMAKSTTEMLHPIILQLFLFEIK